MIYTIYIDDYFYYNIRKFAMTHLHDFVSTTCFREALDLKKKLM